MNARYNKTHGQSLHCSEWRNKSQIFSTPPIQSDLIVLIGYNEKKEEGKQILDETFVVLEGISQYMARIIKKLRLPNLDKQRERLFISIMVEEHTLSWKKEKERTLLVLSELTFNEFKAGNQIKHITQLDYLSWQIPLTKEFISIEYKNVADF